MVTKSSSTTKRRWSTRHNSLSDHLLLTPSMKDLASCFSDHAVRVSDATNAPPLRPLKSGATMKDLASCSASSNSSGGGGTIDPCRFTPFSALTAVACVYRARLSNSNEFTIRVTWSKAQTGGTVLSVGVENSVSAHQLQLKKKKGSRSCVSGNAVVGAYWDFSNAKFSSGPEPIEGFYVVVVVNAEFALLLGDMSEDYVNKFEEKMLTGEFTMISRKEQVLGHSLYSTKARFLDGGTDHEITIRCKGSGHDSKDSELSVCVDRKRVVHVKSLRWNFRGNQTIFVEGLPIDMMWDVHDWCFGSSSSGYAVFMFRRRSALESRLWLEEEKLHKEKGFVLLIQAFRG